MEFTHRGLSIYYESLGNGKPIVMLHGFSPDHRLMSGCMEPVFDGIHASYRRIYIDLPGMGRSQCVSWIASSDAMLDYLIDFIDGVLPGEHILLAGESYGGYLCRGLLTKMPERVDGMLLICPLIIPDSGMRNVPRHTVLVRDEALLSGLSRKDAEEAEASLVVQSEEIYARLVDEVLSGVNIANHDFLVQLRQEYAFSFDVDGQIKEYGKPVLFLHGRQDSCVGYADAWKILEQYPRATFAVLDRAGHNLQIEQDKLFNALVCEWLRRAEESPANP